MMRTQSTSVDDRSAALIPPPVCNHPDDVASTNPVDGWRIEVRFNDGTSGIVDLSRIIWSNEPGVFIELRDPELFAEVSVSLGAVTWPNGIDLAPDAMYSAFRSSGEWVLS